MTTAILIHELEMLPLAEKLLVIEQTLRSIRTERESSLQAAVNTLYEDYKTDQALTAFTQLDSEPFYEAR